MPPFDDLIGILLLLPLLLVLGMLTVFWLKRRERGDELREVKRQFDGVTILALAHDAHFQGLDRSWDSRWRGKGILILTQDHLYFRPSQRTLDMTIPLVQMEQVGVDLKGAAPHLPSVQFQVKYRGSDGQTRTATWKVPEPQHWIRLIESRL